MRDRKALSTGVILFLIFLTTLIFSAVGFSIEQNKKLKFLTELKVVECTSDYILVKNVGNNTASELTCDPEVIFTPSTIKPGETAKGRFKNPIRGIVVVVVRSKEGSKALYQCNILI